MKKVLLFVTMLGVFTSGCKKTESDSSSSSSSQTTTATYYIEGKVDGTMIHCEYRCPYSGCDITTGNYSEFMNNITMQRTISSTDERGWDIEISDVTLDTWQIPDTLNASSLFDQENLQLSYYSGPWQSDNNWMLDGVVMGDNSFTMHVTSKTGDVIEGTFSGELRNGSDDSLRKHVTEGKFKIKLVRI